MTKHRIAPARLKPGVTLEDSARAAPLRRRDAGRRARRRPIRGKALIFWDPKVPGKKLDAIDTDQITPAADCVSESLETLDERWKAGSFRHLMPDFRARVHAGETFLIAGDRFAIGSSREMSPAGLEGRRRGGGPRAGRRLRRTTWATSSAATRSTSGLHVVQSPEAVADAQDGDAFAFDPGHAARSRTRRGARRTSRCRSRRRRRRSAERRHLRGRPPRVPRLACARRRRSSGRTPRLARRMTTDRADRLGASRGQGRARSTPGATLRVYADLLPASDGTAPFAIHTFNQITRRRRRSSRARPRSPTTTSSSPAARPTTSRPRSAASSRALHGIEKPYYADARRRHLPLLLPRAGPRRCPGSSSRAPTRTAAPTARTARSGSAWARRRSASAGRRATSTSRSRKQRRVVFTGELQPWVDGQGHRARAAAALGREAVAGDVGRVRGRGPAAPDRRTATRSPT